MDHDGFRENRRRASSYISYADACQSNSKTTHYTRLLYNDRNASDLNSENNGAMSTRLTYL